MFAISQMDDINKFIHDEMNLFFDCLYYTRDVSVFVVFCFDDGVQAFEKEKAFFKAEGSVLFSFEHEGNELDESYYL